MILKVARFVLCWLFFLKCFDSWTMKALWSFKRLGTTHPTMQRHIAQELNLLLKLVVTLNALFQHENSFTKCQIVGTLFASSYLLARPRFFWQNCWGFACAGLWRCVGWVFPDVSRDRTAFILKGSTSPGRYEGTTILPTLFTQLRSLARVSTKWLVR